MIKHIIFDLDDTLCDYRKATENAKSPINEVLNDILMYHNLVDCGMCMNANDHTITELQ